MATQICQSVADITHRLMTVHCDDNVHIKSPYAYSTFDWDVFRSEFPM